MIHLLKCFFLLAIFILMIIAPFTFLKPNALTSSLRINESAGDKKPLVKVIEQPLHNVVLPDFANIVDIKEKKRQFFNFIRPAIERQQRVVLQERNRIFNFKNQLLTEQMLSGESAQYLMILTKKYQVNQQLSTKAQLDELSKRIDIVPTALVLVQAANESAWGTSRFSRIGLNFFGIWCFRPSCGMVPSGRNDGANHEVAAFKSVDEAVSRYLYNINTHGAYRVFREIRAQLRDYDHPLTPEILATGLLAYSERGSAYVLEITDMIRHNQRYFSAQQSD